MTKQLDVDEKTAVCQPAWQLIKEHLQERKSQIAQEILYYPPPIPACDAQFNFLLEERTRVAQTLDQVDTWADKPLTDKEQLVLLDQFLATSPDLDETAVQEIRAKLTVTCEVTVNWLLWL